MNILQVKKYDLLIEAMIEHAKFTNSPLGKTLEKQTKTIEDHEEKQIKVIEKSNALNKNMFLILKKIAQNF